VISDQSFVLIAEGLLTSLIAEGLLTEVNWARPGDLRPSQRIGLGQETFAHHRETDHWSL